MNRRLVFRTLFLIAVLAALMTVSAFAYNIQGGIVNTGSSLNLRAEPSTTSSVLDRLSDQDRVAVVGQQGNWYKVAYEGTYGWLSSDYVAVQAIMNIECGGAKVTASTLNLRAQPTTDSSVVAKLSQGEVARIIGINAGWFKVQCAKGTGYIHPDYVTVTTASASSGTASVAADNSSSSLRDRIIDYAANFLGIRYTYGGSTPSTGFDCSGFVKYVYSHFGVSLSRSSSSQYSDVTRISKSSLSVGDLVFFSRYAGGSSVGHVGIYVGNGEFIHAPSPGKSVCYDSLGSSYYSSHYIGSGTLLG